MAFDPAQYLAEKSATGGTGGFDPQQYLAEKTGATPERSWGTAIRDTLGSVGSAIQNAAGMDPAHLLKQQSTGGILNKDSPDWLAAADAFVGGMPGAAQGNPNQEHQVRAEKFAKENPWASMGLGVAGGALNPMPEGAPGGPVTSRLQNASRAMETGAEELAARVPAGTAGAYSAMDTAKRRGMGKLLLDEKAISPGSLNLRAVAEKLPAIEAKTGAELSDSIGALDKTGGQFNKRDLLNKFLELADEQRAKGPGGIPVRNKYLAAAKAVADDIEESGPMLSFADAEKYKQGYQEPINYSKAHRTPLDQGSIEIAKGAREGVENAAQVAAEGAGDPSLLQNFLDAKKRSGYAQTANEMANDVGGSIGRLEARGIVGPTARLGGWMGATTALAAGKPGLALSSVGYPPIAQALKSRAVGAMALTARSSSEMLANLAATQPERLGRFAGILRPALNNGSGNLDEFNARSYALSQTEPDFQALTKQLSGK